jgi:hypothetical protein
MESQPVTPLSAEALAARIDGAQKESYIHKDLVAFDQLVNVLADGNPDETISARMARWATAEKPGSVKHHVGSGVCRVLNLIEKDHGAIAEASDLGRAEHVEQIERATPTMQASEGK